MRWSFTSNVNDNFLWRNVRSTPLKMWTCCVKYAKFQYVPNVPHKEAWGHTFTDLETIYADKYADFQEEIFKIQEYFLPTSQDIQKEIKKDSSQIKHLMDNIRTCMNTEETTKPVKPGFTAGQYNKSDVSEFLVKYISPTLRSTGNVIQKIKTSGFSPVTTQSHRTGSDLYRHRQKIINRITKDNKITEFMKTADLEPYSIHSSHINGDLLVGMTDYGEGKVTRYNKTGKELQNIQRDNKGQGLFILPHYITENINGDICTSDFIKKAVVVVNKSGQHRFS
ncbi:uncharacterized protein LOC134252180 [Saccostrea cucullata]|uniref:uncharacterized protein LOC134252180 n=1 Tax=Saccostrea cuccullata TaxID=36930 RepID=UPI002ED1DB2B